MLMRMTLMGMYRYDNELFSKLQVPDGIDVENVINAALDKGAMFRVLYPDCNFLKDYIGRWSVRHKEMFQRWTDAMKMQYEPIRDYYLKRERTDTMVGGNQEKGNNERNRSESNSKEWSENLETQERNSRNGESTRTEEAENSNSTSGQVNGTTENQVSAYDSSNYSPKDKTIETTNTTGSESGTENKEVGESNSETGSRSETKTNGGGENGEVGETISENSSKESSKNQKDDISEEISGTTGRRSYQELVEAELKLAMFEVGERIASLLVEDICIMVY